MSDCQVRREHLTVYGNRSIARHVLPYRCQLLRVQQPQIPDWFGEEHDPVVTTHLLQRHFQKPGMRMEESILHSLQERSINGLPSP